MKPLRKFVDKEGGVKIEISKRFGFTFKRTKELLLKAFKKAQDEFLVSSDGENVVLKKHLKKVLNEKLLGKQLQEELP